MKYARFVLFIFLIVRHVACAAPTKTVTPDVQKWTGKYLQSNGVHELHIDQWDPEGITADFMKTGGSPAERKDTVSSFMAIVEGSMAVWSQGSDCRVKLALRTDGVMVSDFCRGADVIEGMYKIVERK